MHGKLVGRSAPRSCGTAGVSTRCARPPLRYGPSGDTPPAPRLGWQLWALRPGLDACVPTVHNVPGTRRATELRTPHRTGTAGSGLGSGTAGSPAGGAGCAVSLCRRRVDVLTEPTGGPFSRGRRGPFFSCHFHRAGTRVALAGCRGVRCRWRRGAPFCGGRRTAARPGRRACGWPDRRGCRGGHRLRRAARCRPWCSGVGRGAGGGGGRRWLLWSGAGAAGG